VRLVLRLPAGWGAETRDGARTRVAIEPDVSLLVDPLVPFPDDLDAWVRTFLVRDLPPTWVVDIERREDGTTELGWPMITFRLQVRDQAEVKERQICVIYRLLEYLGAVKVRGTTGRWPAIEASLLSVLHSGHPDWGGDAAVCIADLLSLDGGS